MDFRGFAEFDVVQTVVAATTLQLDASQVRLVAKEGEALSLVVSSSGELMDGRA
jgi:hypothetical protein